MPDPTATPMPPAQARVVRGIVCLLALQLATAAPMPWENAPRPQAWCQASADLGCLLLLACFGAVTRARGLVPALAALTCAVPLYRFGETLMPTFYGKPFEPWIDLLELPGLLHLLTHRFSTPVQVLLYLAGAVVLAGVLWSCARVWRSLLPFCARPRAALATLLGVQALFAAAFVCDEASTGALRLLRPSMLRAALLDIAATARTARWHGSGVVEERVHAAAEELARTPQDLAGLQRADVFVLVIESYGRGVLTTKMADDFAADLRAHEAELRQAGWHSAAGWVAPSVRGGGSSLAHAELLSGIAVEDRRVFDHLLASSVRTLATIARDAGYHTVDVQPAMPRPWPEAKALGFAQDVFHHAFGYAGHRYHWGDMPDQFALQHVLTHVVGRRAQPLFVQYVAVSSHAPFRLVPPWIADWTRAGDAAAFATPSASWDISWTTYAGHPQVHDAYLATIRYSLRAAFGFAQQLRAPAVVVVVGDHQPPLPYDDRPERLYDVPLHVVSNRAELVTPWHQLGLRPGLAPPDDGVSFPGARFLFRFLRAYAGERR